MASEPANRVARRYSSLFTLPSFRSIVSGFSVSCILGGMSVILLNPAVEGLILGLLCGAVLLASSLLVEHLCVGALMRRDPIFDFRRRLFLSLVSSWVLLAFTAAASLVAALTRDVDVWVKLASLGFAASSSLRLLVLISVSSLKRWRTLPPALIQPAALLLVLAAFSVGGYGLNVRHLLMAVTTVSVAFLGTFLFTFSVDRVGLKSVGVPSIKLFKAFILNWIKGINGPIESIFDSMSEVKSVKVSMLGFKGSRGFKALIVVPVIHPGPFKNVGSSAIPSMIQRVFEDRFGCVVSVPHGLSGHELDLTSQLESRKVIEWLLEHVDLQPIGSVATPFIQLRRNGASVGCQIFGGRCALLTLTLAPETMEDLPLELEEAIQEEARKAGLQSAVPIDAHNSINGDFDVKRASLILEKAVKDALSEALRLEAYQLRVGAAKVIPTEFGIKEGMGPGGITAIVVDVKGDKAAYVTIDGNNMVSNLRDEILSRLRRIGVDGGEVMTTDTHIVNGVVMVDRGYYPVGEAMDHERLFWYIEKAVRDALGNMEPVSVLWCVEVVPEVRVIGEKQIEDLSLVIDAVFQRTKRTAAVIIPSFAAILTAILALL